MSCPTCPHFDSCSAPLCPEDPASLEHAAWFPDEAACVRQDYSSTAMVRAQRRIARATARDSARGCFTADMLAGVTTISRGIKGLDPETPITSERVTKWLSGFKGRKPLTDEQRAVLRARALKMRASQSGRSVPGGQGSSSSVTFVAETVSKAGLTRQ
jgi:hypothetical protein